MRYVKRIVSPAQEFLHPFAPKVVKPRAQNRQRSRIRDPFAEKAIQRRLNRFSSKNEELARELEGVVRQYLSSDSAEQQQPGETLSTLLGTLWLDQ